MGHNHTKLLLHFDGTQGSTTITDSSAFGHSMRAEGRAFPPPSTHLKTSIDTSQSVFGGSSVFFDSGFGFINGNGSDQMALGTEDFVIDLRFQGGDLGVSGDSTLIQFHHMAYYDDYLQIYVGGTGGDNLRVREGEGAGTVILGAAGNPHDITPGIWYHIAMVRSGGISRLFKDGVQVGSDYTDTNDYKISYAGPLIGGGCDGWIDELRISRGTDRGWFNGFTPPTSAYTVEGEPVRGLVLSNFRYV